MVLSSSKRRLTRNSGLASEGLAKRHVAMMGCARAESGIVIWGPPGFISTQLFQLDGRACGFELLLDLLGLVLVDAFLDRLRSALDQVLGLFQAEAGDRAHLFDHIDLLGTYRGQDDVELGLLLD